MTRTLRMSGRAIAVEHRPIPLRGTLEDKMERAYLVVRAEGVQNAAQAALDHVLTLLPAHQHDAGCRALEGLLHARRKSAAPKPSPAKAKRHAATERLFAATGDA